MSLFNNLTINNVVAADNAIDILNNYIADNNLVGEFLLEDGSKKVNTYMYSLCETINACETKQLKIYVINNVNQLLIPREMAALKKQFEEEIS